MVETRPSRTIAVFCSSQELDGKYIRPAEEFAQLLAANGYSLVWGGTDTGLMRVIASTAQKGGSRLTGVSVPYLQDKARKDADEMIIAKTLGERKATLLERSDAIVALAGGIGTLDELTDIIELKRLKQHDKPIVVLDTDNFYEGLKMQLGRMEADGFITRSLEELVHFAQTPQEAIGYINAKLKKQDPG